MIRSAHIALLLMLAPIAWAQAPEAADEAGKSRAEIDTKTVELEVEDASLGEVLGDLAEQVGVGLIFRGEDDRKVTLSLTDSRFGDCMDLLADGFSLIARWQDDTLLVRRVEDALAEANEQLDEGRVTLLMALHESADGERPMYGSERLREDVGRRLGELVAERTRAALTAATSDPLVADALARTDLHDARTQAALAAVGVRGYAFRWQVDEALRLWELYLQVQNPSVVSISRAELFLALHYSGSERAAEFWAQSFDAGSVTGLLREGWRQRQYRDALHLARLELSYAQTAERAQEAAMLQAAIDGCLGAPRVIKVTCAIDTEALTDPACEVKVRARVAKCSEVYQRAFGIQFAAAEMMRWTPPSDSNFDNQYAALKSALGARRPELTIGVILEVFEMHPEELGPRPHLWTGYGCPHVGPYLLTRDFAFEYVSHAQATEWTFSAASVAETLVHEMGHMFGALHVDAQSSVMRPSPSPPPVFSFDRVNARVIRCQKWKDFTRGVESLDEPELLELVESYRELVGKSARLNGAVQEEARAHLALAKLYFERYDPARAREQLEQVIAIGAPAEIVAEAQRMMGAVRGAGP